MAEPKNPFDFGTGSIDKDQWLRDIDNEQDAFISRYGNAANKHRTALLRQAFADLRTRIANGDMLNRTADGNYQFGSALNREDKHMQEAYQRALGFMGGLARRQIQAPPVAEPEKKAIGSLEERYIKSLNPSGKFNTEAYWKNQTDEERRTALKDFLNRELKDADNYQDFGNFGNKDTYTQRLQTVMNLLESGKANDWSLQQLGFTKNWLTQPTLEEPEEKKSELEQVQADIAAAQEAQQVLQGRQFLAFNGNRGQQEFNFTTPQFDLNYQLQHLLTTPQEMGGGTGFAPSGPSSDILRRAATSRYIGDMLKELDNYFKNFATAWKPLYNNGEDSQRRIGEYLSKLFSTYSKSTNNNETPVSDYAFDWKKYFTLIGLNQFLINGSIDNQTGRYAYYVPGEGIREDNILDNPNQFVAQRLGYTIPSLKEGGKVEFLQSGGGFDYDAWAASLEKPKTQVVSKPQQTSISKLEGSSFSTAENARIAATIADIASMGAAFAPGYGTAASAVLGLGSTATNFGADLADGQGLWDATKNAGFGLAADVMGLIPGLGGVGKGAKIARNLMWAVPKMMQWVNTYQGLQNAGEIKNSIMKLTSPSSMTVQDWQNVSQALQIMTGHGRSVATKIKKAGMSKTTTTTEPEHYIFTNKGKQKVSDETFKRLREARGTKARQALTLELMGEGVTLQQTRFAPWNTSTRFGAFKEVPGKTKVEVQNKHKGWFSDENLVEKAENFNPSVDIRSILSKVNPYRTYYNNRVPKSSPLPEYLKRPVDILPQGFGMTKSGMTAGGFDMDKPKRKPLTEELKAAKRLKAAAKKQEQKAKELENLRRQQMYGMSEEIPQASSQTINIQRKLEQANLTSRFANEVEMPGSQMETLKNKFYRRYGNAVRRHYIGGALKALRNGGIVKAKRGVLLNPDAGSWYDDVFSNYKDLIISQLDAEKANWLNGMLDRHYDLYKSAGNDFYTTPYINLNVKAYLDDYTGGGGFFDHLGDAGKFGFNDVGIAPGYNRLRYVMPGKRISGDNPKDDNPNKFTSDSLFSAITDDRRLLGRRTADYDDWTPEDLAAFNEAIKPKGFKLEVGENGYYKLNPLTNEVIVKPRTTLTGTVKTDPVVRESQVNDKLSGIDTSFDAQYKNPLDPTPFITAGKTALGIYGNKNIYGNLLKEYPHPALQDPLHRQLAIVGDLRIIDEARNKLGDLRKITIQLRGNDSQVNFAKDLETERVGREIFDNAFRLDSSRQFDTAQKLWNLKNEDTFTNWKMSYENRKALENYNKTLALIRAAWRSGNNNILMGAAADTGNWLMKNYQRDQDTVDRARALALGTPEEWAQSEYTSRLGDLANKKASDMTDQEKAKADAIRALVLREMRLKYSEKYYTNFNNGWFGGGYKEKLLGKNGTKLEVEKLKARGKDNDRYVSMIKDLRTTKRRRR